MEIKDTNFSGQVFVKHCLALTTGFLTVTKALKHQIEALPFSLQSGASLRSKLTLGFEWSRPETTVVHCVSIPVFTHTR